jgi:glycosyltransferase involved in cell wall biosynthesis
MSRSPSRPRVIFVAGLDPVAGGGAGGQLTVASTLIRSGLREHVDFIPISSTTKTIPPPPLMTRAGHAAVRVAQFTRELRRADAALIFVSGAASVLEKGLMGRLARLSGRGVVLRFGAGEIQDRCRESPTVRKIVAMALAGAHVVCVQSARWREFYETFDESKGKIVETPNGLVMPAFKARRVDEPRRRVIYVGWMDREKGIFDLLEAFVRLRRVRPDANLVMVGGGRDDEAFRTRVIELDLSAAVACRGWVPHEAIHDALADADAFVLPSRSEGVPNAMLEAMASGLPVVVTPVGGIPDIVTDQEQGLLVPPGDVDSLSAALLRVLSEPATATRMGESGRKVVERRFNIEHVWPIYQAAISRALSEARHQT